MRRPPPLLVALLAGLCLAAATPPWGFWIFAFVGVALLDHVLDGYGSDRTITELVDTTELWFVPVANPDGYDFTFEPGQRLWRKNLRDNNGDGQITVGDGVDLNRNFATKWGYDNEGSSPEISSQTYRGPDAGSEPETKALDALLGRVGFEFYVNYHSAAELLLYGTGWQVATPTPDDVIYEAMAGDDANPAVPGYDPDISAELYTTNGDTDTHMTERYGTLGFTPSVDSQPGSTVGCATSAGVSCISGVTTRSSNASVSTYTPRRRLPPVWHLSPRPPLMTAWRVA